MLFASAADPLAEERAVIDEDLGQRWILDQPWYRRVHDHTAWTEPPPPVEPPD